MTNRSSRNRSLLYVAIALAVILLIGLMLYFAGRSDTVPNVVSKTTAPPPSTQAFAPVSYPTIAPAASAIKVGWLVSQYLANAHVYGAGYHDHVTAIHSRFVDPQIELYALVEPDSLDNPKQQSVISQNFLPNHTLIVTDPAALAKMQVIVASRTFLVRHDVADAINRAVRNGAGLFIHVGIDRSEERSPTIEELTHLQDSGGLFLRPPLPCEVVSDDPLLSGLKATLPDGKLTIPKFNGLVGTLRDATPLIVADPIALKHDGQSSPTTASTEPTMTLYPLYIAQLGKGKIINCQWDSIPPELIATSKGRFYIHCCEWLAGRKLD